MAQSFYDTVYQLTKDKKELDKKQLYDYCTQNVKEKIEESAKKGNDAYQFDEKCRGVVSVKGVEAMLNDGRFLVTNKTNVCDETYYHAPRVSWKK
jgi:hypothetical protein